LAGKDPGTGDSATMVACRAAFLGAGHYAPIAELLPDAEGLVVEVGSGTGYYLASVLDRKSGTSGLALDLSKYAARRAAKAHPRAISVVADCWGSLPLGDESVDLLLDVFAPRNPAEFARILRPTGQLAVVTPLPDHLTEIRTPLGMLDVEENKGERVHDVLAPLFDIRGTAELHRTMLLDHAEVENLVGMGPSARHVDPAPQIAALPERVEVTLAVRLGLYAIRCRDRATPGETLPGTAAPSP
jgi:23S rRNA (guanine745-N1)-methyltransferase